MALPALPALPPVAAPPLAELPPLLEPPVDELEARVKKLSAKLAASGITVDKYMLTSWTVKCVDRETGEEIYYNNKLPAKFVRTPGLGDVPYPVQMEPNLVVEYYAKN